MRGDDEDSLSEWSVIDTRSELRAEQGFRDGVAETGEEASGLRHRRSGQSIYGCGSGSSAVPASQIPKSPEAHLDDDVRTYGCGSRSLAASASDDPKGALTLDDAERRDPVSGVRGLTSAGRELEASDLGVYGDGELQGHLFSFADDLAHAGTEGGAPILPAPCESGEESECESHDSSPAAADFQDEVCDSKTLAQAANVRLEHERERLIVYPGWALITPPRFVWQNQIPEWGGPEGLFHQSIPPAQKNDMWFLDRRRSVLVRFHAKPRRKMYVPSPTGIPTSIQWQALTGRRRTLAKFTTSNARESIEDDFKHLRPLPARYMKDSWTGRTEFEISVQAAPVS